MKHSATWQIQEAKNKLSEVVNAAVERGPQTLTRHGEPVAMILSMAEYLRKTQPERSLVDVLLNAPWRGSDIQFERSQTLSRDIDL